MVHAWGNSRDVEVARDAMINRRSSRHTKAYAIDGSIMHSSLHNVNSSSFKHFSWVIVQDASRTPLRSMSWSSWSDPVPNLCVSPRLSRLARLHTLARLGYDFGVEQIKARKPSFVYAVFRLRAKILITLYSQSLAIRIKSPWDS